MGIAQIGWHSVNGIRSESIARYLRGRGWKQRHHGKEGLLIFEGPMDDHGDPIIQVIPRSDQAPDFAMRARELVRALSVIEDRSVEEVIADIRADQYRENHGVAQGWRITAVREAWRRAPQPLRAAAAAALLMLPLFSVSIALWLDAHRNRILADQEIRALRSASGEKDLKLRELTIAVDKARTTNTDLESKLRSLTKSNETQLARLKELSTSFSESRNLFAEYVASTVARDPSLKLRAIQILSQLYRNDSPPENVVAILKSIAGDPQSTQDISEEALIFLCEKDPRNCIPSIASYIGRFLLGSMDGSARKRAVQFLFSIPAQPAVLALASVLDASSHRNTVPDPGGERDANERIEIIMLLARFGRLGRDAIPSLANQLKYKNDPSVRAAAALAMNQITPALRSVKLETRISGDAKKTEVTIHVALLAPDGRVLVEMPVGANETWRENSVHAIELNLDPTLPWNDIPRSSLRIRSVPSPLSRDTRWSASFTVSGQLSDQTEILLLPNTAITEWPGDRTADKVFPLTRDGQ